MLRRQPDRAKRGTKRHVLSDGGSVPIVLTIPAANTYDTCALTALLDAKILRSPPHTVQYPCVDKGYDHRDIRRPGQVRAP